MAENQESLEKPNLQTELEKKIPLFTVLKNGAILKNIFLLDNPPPITTASIEETKPDFEEILLVVGRHPDCNIVLEHPSISRFHLRIHSNPSTHSLSVIDLSSVHGTWISGNKIEPRAAKKRAILQPVMDSILSMLMLESNRQTPTLLEARMKGNVATRGMKPYQIPNPSQYDSHMDCERSE
ncbi:FHA domain-containing protein PS1 [Nicotiana tabacum]|uniref:FHA domain-containing protein PS1 n=3 Tax=Nicotiana tabacum TaxID=4097 RepID=A0A1S3YSN3_TOBAC